MVRKIYFNIIVFVLCAAIIFTPLFACAGESDSYYTDNGKITYNRDFAHYSSLEFFSTTTDIYIESNFDNKNKEKFQNFINEVEIEFLKIENSISTTNINSDIYKFNNLLDETSIQISDITATLINKSKSVYSLTNKYFNPTLYTFLELWKLSANTYDGTPPAVLPSDSLLTTLEPLSNFDNVILTENLLSKNTESIVIDNTKYTLTIDLGGIAKGYACDIFKNLAATYQYNNGYISLGTSSYQLLEHNGQNWELSIKNPRGTNQIIKTIDVNNLAVSTSGDYERFYKIGDNRYPHVINKNTLKPYNGEIMSATVIGNDGAVCDAMSTAICSMYLLDAKNYINSMTDYKIFIAYTLNGQNYIYTNATKTSFNILDSSYLIDDNA